MNRASRKSQLIRVTLEDKGGQDVDINERIKDQQNFLHITQKFYQQEGRGANRQK